MASLLIVLFLVLAIVCFLATAFSFTHPRINIMALGLAFMALALLVEAWPG